MKKLNYLLLGLAGLTLASCSQDDLQGPIDGTYQLTVNLPKDIATRAIGEQITAPQTLNYTLFEVNGETNTVVESKAVAFANGATSMQLDLPLVKGQSYKIAFFSQATSTIDGAYTYSDGNVTVNYSAMTYGDDVNADAYDCFAGTYTIEKVEASVSDEVTLKRPVAQINWGTDDLTAATVAQAFGTGAANLQTTLTASVSKTLDILSGTYGTAGSVTFPATALPATQESFPVDGYSYLAMQYVLVDGSTTSNLELTVTSNKEGNSMAPIKLEVNNAPLQSNYRTNIYGSLLTDQANLNITLSSTWGEPANDIALIWDGKTVTTPTVDTENMTVAVNAASDLAGLANIINGETTIDDVPATLEGYTVTLAADYDLDGHSLSLGSATRTNDQAIGNSFSGIFDGKGHTISNLKISQPTTGTSNDAIGFIPSLSGENAALQNVTFDNITIDGGTAKQAGVVALVSNGATVSGVTVTSGSVKSGDTGGAVVGRMIRTGSISECHNINVSVSGGEKVGGIVGAAYYNQTDKLMTIENCTNGGTISGTKVVGGIAGLNAGNMSGCSNTGNITCTGGEVGGIVGWQFMSGTISGCTNSGPVNATGSIVGGIVGNISFSTPGNDYPLLATIVVKGNKNEAIISGAGEVGGIIGRANSSTTCSDNINTAPNLNATNGSVAGIIGSLYGTTVLITGNTSSTTLNQMEGKTKNWIYNVSGKDVTPAENSQENIETPPSTN